MSLLFSFFSIWAVISNLIAYRWGFYHLLHEIPVQNRSISSTQLVGVFLAFFGLQIFLGPLVILAWFLFTGNEISGLAREWIQIGVIVVTFLLLCSTAKRFSVWGDSKFWYIKFSKGAASWLLIYPVIVMVGNAIEWFIQQFVTFKEVDQTVVESVRATMDDPSLFICYAATIVLLVPPIEEFLFRGILQGWLREKMGRWGAIAGSSLCFAALHYTDSQGWSNIQYLVALFLFSIFLGFLYERAQSLWAPIGLHVLFNGATITMLSLSSLSFYGV